MKKIYIALILGSAALTSCGDSDCYVCYVESYWTGAKQTEKSEHWEDCQEDGETKEEFIARVKKRTSDPDSHTICRGGPE